MKFKLLYLILVILTQLVNGWTCSSNGGGYTNTYDSTTNNTRVTQNSNGDLVRTIIGFNRAQPCLVVGMEGYSVGAASEFEGYIRRHEMDGLCCLV